MLICGFTFLYMQLHAHVPFLCESSHRFLIHEPVTLKSSFSVPKKPSLKPQMTTAATLLPPPRSQPEDGSAVMRGLIHELSQLK